MKIIVPIDVTPQGRPRFFHGVAVDPAKSRKFKEDFALMVNALRDGSAIYEGEISVELHIFRAMKSTTSKRYGDIDNLVKGIFDALTGVVWKDDKQISRLFVTKNLAETPRVELEVKEVD